MIFYIKSNDNSIWSLPNGIRITANNKWELYRLHRSISNKRGIRFDRRNEINVRLNHMRNNNFPNRLD